MSNIVNDTLNKQIEREELWTGNYNETVIPGGDSVILIVTGASETVFSPSIELSGPATIWLYEDTVTSADGTPITNYNMRRSSGETLLTTTFHTPTVTGAGTSILNTKASPDGRLTQAAALNQDNGIILKASSKYRIYILGDGVSSVYIAASWYLREL